MLAAIAVTAAVDLLLMVALGWQRRQRRQEWQRRWLREAGTRAVHGRRR